jgi:hypothetical protein
VWIPFGLPAGVPFDMFPDLCVCGEQNKLFPSYVGGGGVFLSFHRDTYMLAVISFFAVFKSQTVCSPPASRCCLFVIYIHAYC